MPICLAKGAGQVNIAQHRNYVLDGQQRIITLLLLFSAAKDRYSKELQDLNNQNIQSKKKKKGRTAAAEEEEAQQLDKAKLDLLKRITEVNQVLFQVRV